METAINLIKNASREELEELRGMIAKEMKKFPKQAEKAKQEPSEDQKLRSQIFVVCKEWFLGLNGFEDFYFDGKQAKGLAELIKKMLYRFRRRNPGREPVCGEVFNTFKLFFANVLKLPFYANKVDFKLIDSHFEIILQQLHQVLQNERKSDTVQSARELAASRRSSQ